MTERFAGQRATVMGLGTRAGGVGVARYLVEQGAIVTVTDQKDASELAEPLAALDGLPIRYVLGGHDERDFTPAGADLIVRNPGVPRHAPMLARARQSHLPVEMEMTLFFRACPAPVIGVTGTKGKTSTATLCAATLRAWRPETVLAGNMGVSALQHLPAIAPDTPVVIELSSWQLEGLAEHRLGPAIAVLTMIAPDHLDAYADFDDYAATKRSIGHHLNPVDHLVINRDDPEAWRAAAESSATIVPFGLTDRATDGAWLADERALRWRWRGRDDHVAIPASPHLIGLHHKANALAAMAAARLLGAPATAIATGLARFEGVNDRLELVATIDDVLFVNDTSATAPVAAAAALRSFPNRRIHLIAGGADKRLDAAPLVAEAAGRAEAIYLLDGTATPRLADHLRAAGLTPHGPYDDMASAVSAAARAASPGDVVLLSPGCASFGLFRDEFDRGERFRQAVRALTGREPAVRR